MEHFNEDLLQEYLDGTLDEATHQAVAAHLANDPAAQAQLAELEALFTSFDALPELQLSIDLAERVTAQITQETAVTIPLPRWLWGLLMGQLFIALLLAGDVWALLLEGLGNGSQATANWFKTVQLPTASLFNQLWADAAALWQSPSLPNLTIDLPTAQWGLLFGLALIVWLAGNRLLFTPD